MSPELVLYHVKLPMNLGFGHLAASRNISDSVVLKINLENYSGIGECAPRHYVTGETSVGVCKDLLNLSMTHILDVLRTCPAEDILSNLKVNGFAKTFNIRAGNNLVCLLELAVLDWLGKKLKLSGYMMLTPSYNQNFTNSAIKISAVLDQTLSVDEFIANRGPFHLIKIKGNLDHKKDIEQVSIIRKNIGFETPIVVDANMGWSFDDALLHVKNLRNAGVNFVEEPLSKRSWHDLSKLKRLTGMPIMLDESVCNIDDIEAAIKEECCDVINIRVSKCGGILNAAKMIEVSKSGGLAFQIGVQVAECGPLINAGRILAMINPDALTVEGGQFDRFFDNMIVSPAPKIDRTLNTLYPTTGLGLGFETTNLIDQFQIHTFSQKNNKWS